jgi:hypothetical protein
MSIVKEENPKFYNQWNKKLEEYLNEKDNFW